MTGQEKGDFLILMTA